MLRLADSGKDLDMLEAFGLAMLCGLPSLLWWIARLALVRICALARKGVTEICPLYLYKVKYIANVERSNVERLMMIASAHCERPPMSVCA